MRALERTLPADTQVKMRSGTEDDMRQFRGTAGVKIRNEWVTGTPLAAWFRTQHGLDDPDEASGIVLVSFWRYLHGRPARVEDQVRDARNRSAQLMKKAEAERLRMLDAGAAISGSRLGWQVRQARVPVLTLPRRGTDKHSVHVRYLTPFRGGYLVTGRQFAAEAGVPPVPPDGADEQFRTTCHYAEIEARAIRVVEMPELGPAEECVTVGDATYFRGTRDGHDILLRITPNSRGLIPLPPGEGWLRLGLGEDGLLAIRERTVNRFDGAGWSVVHRAERRLPKTAEPPRQIGSRLYFRDEGRGDGKPGRLSWVTLKPSSGLAYFDRDTGWDALIGFNARVVWAFDRAPDGSLWFLPDSSVVVSDGASRYRMAILNGRPEFEGPRPDIARGLDAVGHPGALEFEPEGCARLATAAAPDDVPAAIYRVCDGVLTPMLTFAATRQIVRTPEGPLSWRWVPVRMLTRDSRSMIVAGAYGGLYLMSLGPNRRWTARSLDEKAGRPIGLW